MDEPNPSGLCQCGCGEPAPIAPETIRKWGWVAGKPKQYIHGHNTRVKNPSKGRPNGGLSRSGDGRTVIWCRDNTYVFYYRAVMEAELRRPLKPEEIVHHINGDPSDDRIENLRLFESNSAHMTFHEAARRRAREAA